MENAADALKMAGSILLFVMALSICILAFSQARETTDTILAYSDRESLYIEDDSRFYYRSSDSDTNRYVGKETIIPAIYRSYLESYKIVFIFKDNHYLFEQNNEKVSYIDLKDQGISENRKEEFLNGIIYGKYEDNSINKFKENFAYKIEPNTTCLYDYLTDKENQGIKVKENLGTYYIEDLQSAEGIRENNSQQSPEEYSSEVSEVNKNEKRVITYTFE